MARYDDLYIKRLQTYFTNSNLPEYMWEGLVRYLQHGIEPGGFMTAVLENRFAEAVCRADGTNGRLLKEWAQFVYTYMPSVTWGSKERVQAYIDSFQAVATNADGHDI